IWSKGVGTQATKKFTNEEFNKFNIEKIGAFTYYHHDASIRLLEKSGFIKVETFMEGRIESSYFELWK
ncbi:MAG: GNAT family N-acetyltransferase, partial [Turicibacter sp.]